MAESDVLDCIGEMLNPDITEVYVQENEGQTIISEGLDANYLDIINYAIFALIKLSE